MADPTRLGIYNDALLILGDARLSSTIDNVPVRYDLDAAWDMSGGSFGSIDYCLELVKPYFSSTVEKLTGGVTSAQHGYTKTYTLNGAGDMTNDDYLSIRAAFIDANLDQPLTRSFMDGEKFSCNFDPVYLQYNADNTFAIPSLGSGVTTSAATNKLIEVGAVFTTYAAAGMSVTNTTDNTTAVIVSVDSDTQLTLDTDIMGSGDSHQIRSYAKLTPSFLKVVSTYLAREICLRLAPDRFDIISKLFGQRVQEAIDIEMSQAALRRSKTPTGTLTSDWLKIYNDAALILGQDKLVDESDDSPLRSFFDTAVDSGIVSTILEEGFWGFASTTTKSDYNPSIEPAFGPNYAHNHPSDLHIFLGVFNDENLRSPLRRYENEANIIYCNNQEIYIQYVSTAYITDPSSWPTVFKRYVAAQIANDVVILVGGDPNKVETELQRRKQKAESWDAQQSPPRVLSTGRWVGSRTSRSNNEDWVQ